MDDRAFASATELANDILDQRIGCAELLDFYLARAERHNRALNAIVVWQVGGGDRRFPAHPKPQSRGTHSHRQRQGGALRGAAVLCRAG